MIRHVALAALVAWGAWQFASQIDLVEVYATVTSASGNQLLRDLTVTDFEVLEDGRPQQVTVFAAGEFPLSVSLVVDRSFSMTGSRLALARSAGHVFLGALRPDDRAMIIGIGSRVETLAPLSGDRTAQHQALNGLEPWGSTALHDAIIEAIAGIQSATGRRALVLLSDGDDRYSRRSVEAVLATARESDVLVYPVALGPEMPPLFGQLAQLTGGRAFHVRRAERLATTLRTIADELRHQYLLGFVPTRRSVSGPRVWRTLEVRVARPGTSVRARQGYFGGER